MSRNKRGSGADEIYATHLFGGFGKYNSNPNINREIIIERNHMRVLGELAVNRFQWKGFPESVDTRFLEMSLFYTALCVVYQDHQYDKLLAVRGTGTGYVNMLDNPVSFTVVGPSQMSAVQPNGDMGAVGMMGKTLSAYDPVRHTDLSPEDKMDKCVPIWANAFRFPDLEIIQIYAKRLATLDRTLEINSKNARRNKILRTSPNTQLSALNVTRSMDIGDEVIVVTDDFAEKNAIEAIDLGILPDSYDKLSLLRTRVWNEVMGLLGIDNANQDKKERLVAAEVGANDSQTDSMRYVSLNARQYAADRINEVFGCNVTVEFRVEVEAKAIRMEQATNPASNAENPDGVDKTKDEN